MGLQDVLVLKKRILLRHIYALDLFLDFQDLLSALIHTCV